MTAVAASACAEAAPQHVVSLNLCTDELLLRLAPKERIASVTWLARDPHRSTVADRARGVAVNRGLAEELLELRPDLVLASAYSARPAVDFLQRHALPVLDLGVPDSIDGIRAQIRQVADVLSEQERGGALIADMDARLARSAPPPAARVSAALIGPYGSLAPSSLLMDEMFASAGLRNLSQDLHAQGGAAAPLERVVFARPDILVVHQTEAGPALAAEALRHPALAALRQTVTVVELPARLLGCPGPQIAEAVEILAEARARHARR